MANETLGGIAWTVDADTSKAVQSVSDFDKAVDKAEQTLTDLDRKAAGTTKAVDQFGTKTQEAGKKTKEMNRVVDAATVGVKDLGAESATTKVKVDALSAGLNTVTPAAAGVQNAVHGVGRAAGQVGIQLQQFIGQIQGGQSAMLALSQQGADIGIVMGAPMVGAIIGISASIAGMLLPELFKTTNALEEIEKATERTRAAMTLSADGIANYSDEMMRLKAISEALLKVKLAGLIAEQQRAMKLAADGAADVVKEFYGLNYMMDLFGNKSTESFESFLQLSEAVRAFKAKPTAEGIKELELALTRATEAGINTTKKGNELSLTLVELITKFKDGEQTIEQFNAALHNTAEVAEQSSTAIKKSVQETISALKEQAKTANETARETAIRRISSTGEASKTDIWLINKQFDKLEAIEAKRQAELEAKRNSRKSTRTRQDPNEKYQQVADRLSVQAVKLQSESLALEKALTLEKAAREGVNDAIKQQISNSYDLRIANAQETEAARAAAKAQSDKDKADAKRDRRIGEKNRAKDLVSGIVNRGTTYSPELLKLQNERDQLETVRELMKDDAELFQQALTQIDEDGAKARMSIAAMTAGSFSSTFDELANVLKKSEGEQSSAFKAMFALSKGFAIAQAGLNLSKAVSDAFAWGGLTPIEKFASAGAIAAAGAGFVSAIAGASYSGREHGGSVMANQTYEVGEKNKPEMLMIPGNNGKVFSNSEVKSMMGGGGGGAPIINNYAAGAGYEVQYRRDDVSKRDVFDIVQSEMTNPNSKGRRGMQQNSNLHGVLGGGRRR